ncbi:unnamed protein product [Cyberlindnera jadinii]|uniref:Uncharacterized protein n=1 Tax=Cyberlindnera jadinii (strain ATCC 18201 / CBS 1600 / BCRC 20928 / JCM 3617 / NBRC 0987 / NRRL Y-1542) TaxID=983966 RepID=A0A0H5C2C8_CYBJN|nr:unnamed protein product [Cyberlindnera jadinii]
MQLQLISHHLHGPLSGSLLPIQMVVSPQCKPHIHRDSHPSGPLSQRLQRDPLDWAPYREPWVSSKQVPTQQSRTVFKVQLEQVL